MEKKRKEKKRVGCTANKFMNKVESNQTWPCSDISLILINITQINEEMNTRFTPCIIVQHNLPKC